MYWIINRETQNIFKWTVRIFPELSLPTDLFILTHSLYELQILQHLISHLIYYKMNDWPLQRFLSHHHSRSHNMTVAHIENNYIPMFKLFPTFDSVIVGTFRWNTASSYLLYFHHPSSHKSFYATRVHCLALLVSFNRFGCLPIWYSPEIYHSCKTFKMWV